MPTYRFVPLHAPEREAVDAVREMRRRVALFLRRCRATFTAGELVEATAARLATLREFMYERAAAGDASFARHIAEDDADVYQRDAAFLDRQGTELLGAVD